MVVLTYVGAGNGMSPLQEMYTPLTIVFPADLPPLQDKVMLWSPGWLRAHTRAQPRDHSLNLSNAGITSVSRYTQLL